VAPGATQSPQLPTLSQEAAKTEWAQGQASTVVAAGPAPPDPVFRGALERDGIRPMMLSKLAGALGTSGLLS
jgi:hypothetical protein